MFIVTECGCNRELAGFELAVCAFGRVERAAPIRAPVDVRVHGGGLPSVPYSLSS